MVQSDLASTFGLGTYVTHATRGLGKIVYFDETVVHVYFRDHPGPRPEDRIGRFKADTWHFLEAGQQAPDPVLDNLPPWTGTAFERFSTPLTIEAAKSAFLRRFPGGFEDTEFQRVETLYKREAHRRFNEELLPSVASWVAEHDATAIAAGLEHVYGRSLSAGLGLNLLFARAEEPAYFDALRAGGEATVELADALVAYLDSTSEADLRRYIHAVAGLPQRPGGASTFTWPTVTWLCFVAKPQCCMMVKPTIVQSFASASAREIGYRSEPNARTYASIMSFSDDLRHSLQSSEVNLSGRELDMIDVQSFMWVVERYAKA